MAARGDDLRDRLDKLCRESNTDVVKDIQNFQEKHFAKFSKEYGRFLEQYEMFYSALVGLTHAVNYYDKSKWPQHRALQFTLAAHSQKQLYTAYFLLYQGFYEDSITLIRSAYETFLRVLFISCNPKHSWNVFGNKEGGPQFNATNFVTEELKLDWPTYRLMSSFAHSNKVDVLEDIVKVSKEAQKEPIALRLKYDEKKLGVAVNYLQFLMLVFLKLLNEVFIADYSSHKQRAEIQAEFDKAKEYAELLMQTMETHTNNETWRAVAKDLKDIFKLIHAMEKNSDQDWKNVWTELRSA
jgi:hypothetical protein